MPSLRKHLRKAASATTHRKVRPYPAPPSVEATRSPAPIPAAAVINPGPTSFDSLNSADRSWATFVVNCRHLSSSNACEVPQAIKIPLFLEGDRAQTERGNVQCSMVNCHLSFKVRASRG